LGAIEAVELYAALETTTLATVSNGGFEVGLSEGMEQVDSDFSAHGGIGAFGDYEGDLFSPATTLAIPSDDATSGTNVTAMTLENGVEADLFGEDWTSEFLHSMFPSLDTSTFSSISNNEGRTDNGGEEFQTHGSNENYVGSTHAAAPSPTALGDGDMQLDTSALADENALLSPDKQQYTLSIPRASSGRASSSWSNSFEECEADGTNSAFLSPARAAPYSTSRNGQQPRSAAGQLNSPAQQQYTVRIPGAPSGGIFDLGGSISDAMGADGFNAASLSSDRKAPSSTSRKGQQPRSAAGQLNSPAQQQYTVSIPGTLSTGIFQSHSSHESFECEMEEAAFSSSVTAAGEFGTRNGPTPRSAADKQLRIASKKDKRRATKQIEVCLEGTTEAPWVTAGLELAVPEVSLSLGSSEGASSALPEDALGASAHNPGASDEVMADLDDGGANLHGSPGTHAAVGQGRATEASPMALEGGSLPNASSSGESAASLSSVTHDADNTEVSIRHSFSPEARRRRNADLKAKRRAKQALASQGH